MNDSELRDEINKRFTLNWLIQGAAQHAGITFHHVVRGEIDALDPNLIRLYDEYALINLLQYWSPDGALIFGWPPIFWWKARINPRHPFFHHPVLSRHGGTLAAEARRRGKERCKEKGFWQLRYFFPFRVLGVIEQLRVKELPHQRELVALARRAVTTVWGIPESQLEAQITHNVAFGKLTTPRTLGGRMFRSCAVGYGGVMRRQSGLKVVGRGTNWQLVAKELVKGTAELICLHGVNRLTEEVYGKVIAAADGIDFEPWMLQTGGELWRRFLMVVPKDLPLAELLMLVALMPARPLEEFMLAMIEDPPRAKELLAEWVSRRVDT